jgi:hypothetical protein
MFRRTPRRALLTLALALAALAWPPAPPAAVAQASNLLQDSGFEAGASAWALCGSAEVVDAGAPGVTPAMVYGGRRAVRLTYSEGAICGSPVFDPHGAAVQTVAIPAGAEDVSISFWYSRVGNPVWDLKVSLAEPGGFGYLAEVDIENLPGWHLFRYELSLQQLEAVRGRSVELKLAAEYSVNTSSPPQEERPGFYVDEVRVVPAIERTPASPRPPELRPDGAAPIVYLDAELGGIARMEADGSGARRIYASGVTPASPTWSSGGDRVAVIEGWLTPEDTSDVRVNNAQISRVIVFDGAGGNVRELYRTAGLPGFRPTLPTPGDPERPALDVEASSIAWSPDDRQVALAICARNRYKNGSSEDPTCWVELIDVATGKSNGKFEPGFAPRWSRANRIIYSNEDAYKAKAQGIYEVDLAVAPPVERLLVPGMGAQFKPAFYADRDPAWSPEGSRFVTIRKVDGYHLDQGGNTVAHYGLMLFSRGDPLGRQILLIDQGGSPGNLTWSADGNIVLYTLFQGQGADIWWADVRTGATGPLTEGGVSGAPSWRLGALPGSARLPPRAYLPAVRR